MLGVTGGQILFEALVNPENNFIKQLKFIGPVLTSPLSLAVNSNSDIKSIADLFDRSKSRRRINIAVGGESHQMLVNLIAQHSHHDIQGVRFKGGVDGYTALRGGHVDAQVDVYGWFTQYLPDIRIVAVAQEQPMKHAPSIHQWVPSATLVNFFAIAINQDTKDTQSIEKAFTDGMYRSNRNLYWEQQGYNIDRNPRADYVERIVVPTYTRWKSQLSNTKKSQL
jgi:tripartite-type tricarboxylate transporter receptor subunit TctC